MRRLHEEGFTLLQHRRGAGQWRGIVGGPGIGRSVVVEQEGGDGVATEQESLWGRWMMFYD